MKSIYAVILAGGGGTRLWPISRRMRPKHLLPLIGERTLFQSTLDRLAGFIPTENTYVVTTAEQEAELAVQAAYLPKPNFLIEPMPRGTAAAVGLAAAVLEKRDPGAVMLVLPADHYIRNSSEFQEVLRVAANVARDDFLVTLGISPTFPATGYGYIRQGESLPPKYDHPVFRAEQFVEKPDEEKATAMLATGGYSWNSGMFIWRAGLILKEISEQMPALSKSLVLIQNAMNSAGWEGVVARVWPKITPETIDYGIMENAANVAVIPASGLGWSDVGSWDSLFEVLPPDEHGNISMNSERMLLETNRSLVFSTDKKMIVTIGVNDLIIIDTEDALLVCRKDQAQQVRQVISNLKTAKLEKYL